MDLRTTTDADLEIVMTWIRNQEENRLWGGPGVRFPHTLKNIKADIKFDNRDTFSMVDHENELCGLGQVLLKSPSRIHLARIIVSSRKRGMGYGKTLCSLLMTKGIELYGKHNFSLFVYDHNLPAVKTYRSLGFKPETPPAGSIKLDGATYMCLTQSHC